MDGYCPANIYLQIFWRQVWFNFNLFIIKVSNLKSSHLFGEEEEVPMRWKPVSSLTSAADVSLFRHMVTVIVRSSLQQSARSDCLYCFLDLTSESCCCAAVRVDHSNSHIRCCKLSHLIVYLKENLWQWSTRMVKRPSLTSSQGWFSRGELTTMLRRSRFLWMAYTTETSYFQNTQVQCNLPRGGTRAVQKSKGIASPDQESYHWLWVRELCQVQRHCQGLLQFLHPNNRTRGSWWG